MIVERWLFSLPTKKRVAIADAVFLTEDSATQAAERDELRKKRQLGLHALAAISLAAIPAILSASLWESDGQMGARALAYSAVIFAAGFIAAAAGTFLTWFEPKLRRRAPTKRFVIGIDDEGDHDDQATQYWHLDWVEENAHTAIPTALVWRAIEFAIWVSILSSALLFATGLLVGGLGVLSALGRS
jgi:hypothetical protein